MRLFKRFFNHRARSLKERECIKELISDILEFTEDREIDEEEFHKLREKAYEFLIDLDLDK